MKSENVGTMDLENVSKALYRMASDITTLKGPKGVKVGEVPLYVLRTVEDLVKQGASPEYIYQAASNMKHEALKAQVGEQDVLFKSYSPRWFLSEMLANLAMLTMAVCFSNYPEHKESYKAAREAYIARRAERRLAWHSAGKELKPMDGEM